jgi:hypothetical protein
MCRTTANRKDMKSNMYSYSCKVFFLLQQQLANLQETIRYQGTKAFVMTHRHITQACIFHSSIMLLAKTESKDDLITSRECS